MKIIDLPDVDIEVADRENTAKLFGTAVVASQVAHKDLMRHNSGLYFQNIPVNPVNNLAVFPYDEAEKLGFYKIDLLPCPYPYDNIKSMDELRALLAEPIDWSWFTIVEFVSLLFHFGGTVNSNLTMAEVVVSYKPTSIIDLACMIAIKLPAKKYLIGEPWEVINEQIWIKEEKSGRQFKKSHSISYALVVGLDARLKARQYLL